MIPLPALRSDIARAQCLLDAIDTAAEQHHTTADLIWSLCREDPVRDARAEAWAILHREGWTVSLIAAVWERDPHTVSEVLNRRLGIVREKEAA